MAGKVIIGLRYQGGRSPFDEKKPKMYRPFAHSSAPSKPSFGASFAAIFVAYAALIASGVRGESGLSSANEVDSPAAACTLMSSTSNCSAADGRSKQILSHQILERFAKKRWRSSSTAVRSLR